MTSNSLYSTNMIKEMLIKKKSDPINQHSKFFINKKFKAKTIYTLMPEIIYYPCQ